MTALRILIPMLCIWGVISPQIVTAALIQLRPQCTVSAPVIRLGDLAEIRGVDPVTLRRLQAIAFQPAPGNGRQVHVRLEDIKSRMQALGENLAALEFRGSSIIEVHGPPLQQAKYQARFSHRQQSQIERRVSGVIQKHVDAYTPSVRVAAIAVPDDPTAVSELLTSNIAYWKIEGGQAPWTGKQRFSDSHTSPEQRSCHRTGRAVGAKTSAPGAETSRRYRARHSTPRSVVEAGYCIAARAARY